LTRAVLPGIFPYLLTGLITASGGGWNASIVAEYFHLKGQILTTAGLGAQISSASDAGRFDLLLLSTVVMAVLVVCINRSVWRRFIDWPKSVIASNREGSPAPEDSRSPSRGLCVTHRIACE
jgi:ABC-type anion transport system duplicated permease subunit